MCLWKQLLTACGPHAYPFSGLAVHGEVCIAVISQQHFRPLLGAGHISAAALSKCCHGSRQHNEPRLPKVPLTAQYPFLW